MTMPSALDVRVLESGSTEAQENEVDEDYNAESGGHRPFEVPTIQFSAPQRPPRPAIPEVIEATTDSAAHDQIEIGSLLDNRLRMRESITLVMEREDEFYIAKYDELNEIGYGDDPISAVQDIRNTIAELYWQLKENEERLGTDLTITWQKLSALVCEG